MKDLRWPPGAQPFVDEKHRARCRRMGSSLEGSNKVGLSKEVGPTARLALAYIYNMVRHVPRLWIYSLPFLLHKRIRTQSSDCLRQT